MDLGFAGSTAVVTGGSKGMGLAIAETLAAEGARVAVMARGRAALDAAQEKLRAAGAPDTVGISVDMADAASIVDGFAFVADRWGELNSLVHTIGPGDGYSRRWATRMGRCLRARHHVGWRPIRAALPMLRAADWARIVTLSAHSISDKSTHRRLHRVKGSALQRHQELVEKPCQGWHSGQLCVPGTIVTASFTENLKDILAADGLDATNPHDVMTIDNNFHQPCDLGRAGLPEEIASITAYLASRRNGYVTGQQ